MNNIILSDIYRVRKGKILRLVCIVIFLIILLFAALTLFSQSDLYAKLVIAPDDMTESEAEELVKDIENTQQQKRRVNSGAVFGAEVLGQFFVSFLILPVIVAVSGADFSAKTYRNILSFEYSRTRIYMAKLLLSSAICCFLLLGSLAASWVIGSLVFGFSGFTLKYFGDVFIVLIMQSLVSLAIISVCQMLLVVTKRVLTTIILFCATQIAAMVMLRELASGTSSLAWLLLIEPYSNGSVVSVNNMASANNILFMACYYLGVIAITTFLGVSCFRKTDMP